MSFWGCENVLELDYGDDVVNALTTSELFKFNYFF